MDLESRLPEGLDPKVAEVLAVFRKHLSIRSLEGLLEKRGEHLVLL